MNNVFISGYVQDEPKISTNGMGSARFTLCVGRGKGKNGEALGFDYPNVVCFGNSVDYVSQNVGKGHYVTIVGKISTGSYEDRNGNKVYTTDVVAQRIEDAIALSQAAKKRVEQQEARDYDGWV